MENFKYCIEDSKGYIIARFKNESDRDICIDAIREFYEDCEFLATEPD